MAIAKKIGRPTCVAASSVTWRRSAGVSEGSASADPPAAFFLASASSQWRMTFSVITIPASTSTPMAMAMPESDMMFEEMPNRSISTNETRMLSGSGMVTMRMLRKWNRKTMCANVTSTISSISACFRVSIVRAMRSLRS